ncbi:hypothetical protein CkaCkLH20_02394 [Colletotrichum karsti]|uniref:Uncharacterized protein n=1 Tax=Colletotrichum karsti TaxID=1095194 RepID=A0A9P6LP54_9PEZI|nr:uncharacterized protein CkaCkLH20_02394 [Colletotrichum karsti]KAF9880440.1 hypothetical protein CkaCkLH20_02394 [Colletotrichum karsti]
MKLSRILFVVLGALTTNVQTGPGHALPLASDFRETSLSSSTPRKIFQKACDVYDNTIETKESIFDGRVPDTSTEHAVQNSLNLRIGWTPSRRSCSESVDRLSNAQFKIANADPWNGPAKASTSVSSIGLFLSFVGFLLSFFTFLKDRIMKPTSRLTWIGRLAGWENNTAKFDGLERRLVALENLAGIPAPNTPPPQGLPVATPNLVTCVINLLGRTERIEGAMRDHVGYVLDNLPAVGDSLLTRVNACDTNHNNFRASVDSLRANVTTLDKGFTAQLHSTGTDITTLQANLANLTSNVTAPQTGLGDQLRSAVNNITTVEANLANLTSNVTAPQTGLGDQLRSAVNNITTVQVGVAGLMNDITTTGTGLKARLSSAESRVESMGNSITVIQESVKSLSDNITDPKTGLTHQVEELNTDFRKHQTQTSAHM